MWYGRQMSLLQATGTMFTTLLCVVLIAVTSATECGRKPAQARWDGYIVNGRTSTPGAWPWQLSLQLHRDGNWMHICGAALVTAEWVVTASHCVHGLGTPSTMRIAAGQWSLEEPEQNRQILSIKKIIEHEEYNEDTSLGVPNDVALIKLETPADLSRDGVELACLPPKGVDFAGQKCWISGWGQEKWYKFGQAAPYLMEAEVPIPTNAECNRQFYQGQVKAHHICAGNGNPNACSGDSGGPMSCEYNGVWYVAGVTSWGSLMCQGVPGVYTRLTYYDDWIKEHMANN